ncbi:S41 family peptidase [uncultured Lactobacillus sp.]|uniref:S41 family peptidase n=1 Tax=uncultured Lactobacillus sp. TaxID=153152 RepID=UPI002619AD1A|nr:S41 family peptidase [uncultured Lactobacillus sp.]
MTKQESDQDKNTFKKRKLHLPRPAQFVITGICSAVLGGAVTYGYLYFENQNTPLASVEKVYNQLQQTYYKKTDPSKLQQGAINGMLSSLNDPYSEQLSGTSQDQINSVIQGTSFGGIGVQMQVKDNKILVDSIINDSPASKSNIKPGDEILSVDGKQVKASEFQKVSSLVRGKKGTKVTLKLKRNNSTFDVTLTRATIQQSTLSIKNIDNATVITISQFDSNTSKDLKKALKKINTKKYPKLIINLQDNPGGVMSGALESASYFVPNGKKIMIYQSRNKKKIIRSSNKLSGNFKTNLKPIILINDNTASASEIFTAALVQNNRAVTVGQTSFGKGTVQEVGASDNVEYKYTIAKWLTPNGDWINHKGIKPTYPVKDSSLANLPQFQTSQLLKENMMGLDVAILQQYLTALGYMSNHLTGVFDAQTKAAVINFQKANDLKSTGTVDLSMRQSLYLAVAQKLQSNDPAMQKALSLNY